jgi:hypothetical protein
VGIVLAAYLASCTHTPTGQKAFDTFEQCIGANLGIAAAGGGAVGALGAAFTRQITGDRSTATKVGVTAGVAAAVMIGLTAWKKCAAVYNTSERVTPPPTTTPPPQAAVPQRRPGLNLERLEVRVEGTENDPPIPEFAFSFVAENPAAKDIKARFRHKVEIVRFKADDNDKLILADAKGDALKDSGGRNIPLEAAVRMPRERLFWVTIAEEGKDDYVEDVVIQQMQGEIYRHKLQVPPRAQLPLPLPVPMRYTLTVEAEGFQSPRTVDFALLGTAERPKRFLSTASAAGAAASPAAAQSAASASPPSGARTAESRSASAPATTAAAATNAFTPTHKLKRGVPVYSDATPSRKAIGRINKDTPVRIEERTTVNVNNRSTEWVRVGVANGPGGWIPFAELEAK